MHHVIITVLATSIPILVLIIALSTFLLYKKSERHIYEKKYKKTREQLNLERETYFNAMINRIDIVTRNNPRFKELNKKVSEVYTKLIDVIEDARVSLRNFKKELYPIRINTKRIKLILEECYSSKKELESLANKFEEMSSMIVQQDDFIRNEFNFYQDKLRKVSKIYTSKMVQLMHINEPIENLIIKLKNAEKDFNDLIMVSKVKEAEKIIKVYSTHILKFIKVVDEGVSFGTYLNKTIPSLSKRINSKYKKLTDKLAFALEHIEYERKLKDIAKSYSKAKASFLKLDMQKCKTYIIKILKEFKSLDHVLNFELKSRDYFTQNYDKTIVEAQKLFKAHLFLQKKYQKHITNKVSNFQEIHENMLNIQKIIKDLNQSFGEFKKLKTDIKTPFSAKRASMELFLGQINWSIKMLNEFSRKIWKIISEVSLVKNQFNRSNSAIQEAMMNIREYKINLSEFESQQLAWIQNQQFKIKQMLEKNNSNQMGTIMDKFTKKSSDFYKLITIKFKIATFVQNMLQELAPYRAENDKMDIVLKKAEQEYLEGKYSIALNDIIEVMSKGRK